MKHLASLNLDSNTITDASLRYVACLSSPLRHLDLFGSKITDMGIKFICSPAFVNLQSLEVCGGCITDIGVKAIARQMVRLESLNLANNHRITDGAMPYISSLKSLRNLNLTHSRVTSDGILYLVVLQRLESLSIHECKISKSAITKLQMAIKSLKSIGHGWMNEKNQQSLTFSSFFDVRS